MGTGGPCPHRAYGLTQDTSVIRVLMEETPCSRGRWACEDSVGRNTGKLLVARTPQGRVKRDECGLSGSIWRAMWPQWEAQKDTSQKEGVRNSCFSAVSCMANVYVFVDLCFWVFFLSGKA